MSLGVYRRLAAVLLGLTPLTLNLLLRVVGVCDNSELNEAIFGVAITVLLLTIDVYVVWKFCAFSPLDTARTFFTFLRSETGESKSIYD